jgi:hypothetical protein
MLSSSRSIKAAGLTSAALSLAACGGGSEPQAEPVKTAAAAATQTPAATATATPEQVTHARTAQACTKLWNSQVLPLSNTQVTAPDFVAELAKKHATPVRVVYQKRFCWVIARISDRRIAIFTAANGTGSYTIPDRQSLKAGQHVDYNARGAQDGRVSLSG